MRSNLLRMPEKGLSKDHQPKFEILSCPSNKKDCIPQLPAINQYFNDSQVHLLNKDYQNSIEALRLAYDITFEIKETACFNCADIFRVSIISSLENIQSELQKMTSGWFKANRYRSSLELVTQVLNEYKRIKEDLPDHNGFNVHKLTDTDSR